LARHVYARAPVSRGIWDTTLEAFQLKPPALASIQRWTLRAGLFVLPLAYTQSTYDRWVLPKLMVARVLLLLLAALLAIRVVREGRFTLKRTPLDLPLLAFLVSACAATILAVNVNVAVFGIYERYDGLLTLLTYIGLFWLAVQTLEGPQDAKGLLRTLVASAYVVSAIAILQVVTDSFSSKVLLLQWTDSIQGSVARAYGTLGQWNVLGEFLVLAWPLALWELLRASSVRARVLSLNAVLVIGLALMFTFSRSAWAAAALAASVVLVGSWASLGRKLLFSGAAVASTAVLVGAVVALSGGSRFESYLLAHVSTYLHPEQWDQRLLYWRDTMRLISSRPLFGYGPDSFGLVFPKFQTFYSPVQVDKAHAETLQVAATQGLIGLAGYLWLMVAFCLSFWRGRRALGAVAVFAGWVGYQTILQVNFTALGSAFPYWLFAAAALHSFGAVSSGRTVALEPAGAWALRAAAIPLAAIAVAGVIFPLVADAQLLAAVQADRNGDGAVARSESTHAASLVPTESVYFVEVGNVAYERGDWADARSAYITAASLGTYNPQVYRNLAFADRNLGLAAEARTAALASYDLGRLDPVNQAVLAQFGGPNA
jgi:O-antigen ligase